jgi:hypothetical protein
MRNIIVRLRLNEKEHNSLKSKAVMLSLSVSAFIRLLVTESKIQLQLPVATKNKRYENIEYHGP